MNELITTRRELLIAPLLAALPMALLTRAAEAAGPDPTMTIVKPPGELTWTRSPGSPGKSVENALLWGESSHVGLYYNLTKWYPGYMSAPHWYEEDRYCVVLSGTWWVTSGDRFDPEDTIPAPAGSFVHRVARTPHYDGVKRDGTEPAVIAICGMGPITLHPVDPNLPRIRTV